MSVDPLPTAAASTEEHVAWCLLDARGRVLEEADADRPFYAASTIKLHVLLAALQAAQGGALDLDAEVAATRSFVGVDGRPFTLRGDHLDPTHPADGTPVLVRALLGDGVDAPPAAGLAAVARTISGLGLGATRVERLIGDASAIAGGATNETTAQDLARTLHTLVTTPDQPALVLDALRGQQIRVITTALRDGVDAGSKTGWVDGYRHDVAFVGTPGDGALRVLAVMTAGLDKERADARILAEARRLLPAAVLRQD